MINAGRPRLYYSWYSILFVLALVLPGVAQGNLPLAQIENQEILESEFRAYAEKIPVAYQMGKTGAEANRILLNGLIDKKLLLAEAKRVGIGAELGFKRKIEQFAQAQVVKYFKTLEVDQKISIRKEEMMKHARDTHRDRALRYAGILLETKDRAHEMLEKLAAGSDFGELAKEHSLYEKTRDQGGDIERYSIVDDTASPFRSIFSLQVGDLSEPLPLSGEGGRYAIFKIIDENPVPFEDSAQLVQEELFAQKRLERTAVLRDSLVSKYAPQVHGDKIDDVLVRLSLSPAEREQDPEGGMEVLCRYDGGVITIDDFVLSVPEKEEGYSRNYQRDWLTDYLQNSVVSNRMFLEAAYEMELDQHPMILAAVANERDDRLVSILRKKEVEGQMASVTDAEARAFYDQNPKKFQGFASIITTEILVAFKEQAQSLKEELAGGANAEQLAIDYTIRKDMTDHKGRLVLSPVGLYQDLYNVAKDLQIGDVGGPLKVRDGYSVFKVVEKRPAPKKPYHAFSKRRAQAYVRIARSQKAYVEYLRGLREQYSVQVFDENLSKIQ